MDFQQVREEAARRIFEIYPPDRQGRGFICPICGNGSGHSGDGVSFIKDSFRVHCFKCGFGGDIIALKARENNCSYKDAARALAVVLGIGDDYDKKFVDKKLLAEGNFKLNENASSPNLPQTFSSQVEEEKVDCTEFFSDAEKNLQLTDYHLKRGLSWDTAHKFNLGFVKNWRHPKITNAPESPRLIIPTSDFSYLARDVRQNLSESAQKYSKQKFGAAQIFNLPALNSELIFIVEGEFDAMSFYEVGFNAVALGSISNYRKLLDEMMKKNPSTKGFLPTIYILALDNDKAGRATARTLRQIFNDLNFFNMIVRDIYGDFKDANDALVNNRKKFSDAVKRNADTARENFFTKYFNDLHV
ncbi:MAG: toprim domain-containing protein [Selenomonadaceae bacterium]|nr:toprim domain-containing protein [Selenomonadaceae bacterium]